MTLDEKVNQNTQNIVDIKRDVDIIMNNHLKHMENDLQELRYDVKTLNANVLKMLSILAEKK
jgi:archaellum component FlaC